MYRSTGNHVSGLQKLQFSVEKFEFYMKLAEWVAVVEYSHAFLKVCSCNIALNLFDLFHLSVPLRRLPAEWKAAHMTPVHKNGLK
jgi:hypothetical protein